MGKIGPYDQNHAQREISRMQGLDPGSGPGLEDHTTDVTAETPTLSEMTTLDYEHPPIAPVGTAPHGRKLSEDAPSGRSPVYGRTWHVAEGVERRER